MAKEDSQAPLHDAIKKLDDLTTIHSNRPEVVQLLSRFMVLNRPPDAYASEKIGNVQDAFDDACKPWRGIDRRDAYLRAILGLEGIISEDGCSLKTPLR